MNLLYIFMLMIFVHLLLDFPLQGDFMAKGKNHKNPIPGVPPGTLLLSHAFMHAFGVYIVTENVVCATIEFASHTLIDFAKCDNRISFNTDQALHVLTKVVILIYLFS